MLNKLRNKVRAIKPYLPLESEPTEGARSRTVKQSSAAPVPEVPNDAKSKVLAYLKKHQDELISYDDIARGSGTSKSKVGRQIAALVDEGIVAKSESRPRHGTRYWINSSGPNTEGKNTETPGSSDSEDDDVDFVETTRELVFAFIRATRSTDLLLYLTWLENQGNNNG